MQTLYAVLVGLAVLVLSGCSKPAESTTRVGNDFEVGKLFTVDGCTVYRFEDGGRSHYFTNCSGSTNYTISNGKTSYQAGITGGRP